MGNSGISLLAGEIEMLLLAYISIILEILGVILVALDDLTSRGVGDSFSSGIESSGASISMQSAKAFGLTLLPI